MAARLTSLAFLILLLACQAAESQQPTSTASPTEDDEVLRAADEEISAADKAIVEARLAEEETSRRSNQSYLCIPEAVVGIRTVGNSFEPGVIDTRNRKVVLSNASGQFRARWHGNDHPFLDRCDAQGWTCKFYLDGEGGTFSRTSAGTFLMSWGELGTNKQEAYYLAQGRCSKI